MDSCAALPLHGFDVRPPHRQNAEICYEGIFLPLDR
ncbi:hypothetical protein LCGC14_2468490, partial [marine sediment metagenome]